MINPLIIARNENAGLFRKICSELGANQRELIGDDWSLAIFLKRDLKNYAYQSHYIIDLSAVTEKDDDFVSLVEGLTYQIDKSKIVIYADEHYAGDTLLDKLVHSGITNIVACYSDLKDKDNYAAMTADLKDCLSENGLPQEKWRRFDNSFDAIAQAREEAEKAEKEAAKPRFAKAEIHVAVVGAQTRIGTTTFALRLAEYFRSRDAQSVVVCASKRGISQLEMISDSFDSTMNTDGIFTIGNGIDICSTSADPQKKYNVEVYDFGNTSTSAIKFDDFDKIYLVGGTSWNELPMIYAAQQPLNSINYTVAVNFSTADKIEKCREALAVNLNDIINLPLEADPFVISSYEDMLDNQFQSWSDKTITPENAENDADYENEVG